MVIDPWHVFSAHFGQMPNPATALVTLLDMVLYIALCINVGRARKKHKVEAPQTDGPDEFQRIFRTQMNTLEQLALHLPLLWVASFAMDDVFAAAFGSVWLLGRVLYARGYYRKAKSRAKGFIISMLVNVVLFLCALSSVVASL